MDIYNVLNSIKTIIVVKDKNGNIVWNNNEYGIMLSNIKVKDHIIKLNDEYYDYQVKTHMIYGEEYTIEEFTNITKYVGIIENLKRDTLTGLYTRNVIYEKLEQLNKVSIKHNRVFSLVMADIDHFKDINDKYGHLNGDMALKYISDLLVKFTQKIGIVGRFGGEEFIILFPSTTKKEAYYMMSQIIEELNNSTIIIAGDEVKITMTFGISSSDGYKSSQKVIEEADEALYDGKRSGRNQVLTYKSE